MTLKQGSNNHIYKVKSIHTEIHLERRLEALGLTDSSFITVVNNDKRGALTVKFRGTRFAIGKSIAEHIEVTEVNS